MAYTRAKRGSVKKGSRYKVGARAKRVTRPAGAFYQYRSTRFLPIRVAAKSINNPRISRGLSPFPQSKIVRHKYVETINFPGGAVAGASALYQYRANSMYDPNYSGVGHQPMFRDEMAAQYSYYTVLSSYIKVTFPCEDNTKREIALWLDDDGFVPVTYYQMGENHRAYHNIILSKRNTPLRLNAKYNAARFNKTTLAGLLADNDHKTASNSDPTATATKWFNIQCWPQNAADTLGSVAATVEMYFITMWREPVDHPTS